MIDIWWWLVGFGFRLLYNEMAFTYDLVSYIVSLGAWRCWGRTALKHLSAAPGAHILELAHGTGNLQLDLHAAGYQTIGYDLSPYMGKIARYKLLKAGFSPNLIRGKAQQLPLAGESFAAVISTFPTDFITEPETLNEIYRILQPGGQLIIVPNAVLTAGGLSRAGLEWLYRITGQRGGSGTNIATFFSSYGFDARLVEEACPRSVVQVIVAQKKGLDFSVKA